MRGGIAYCCFVGCVLLAMTTATLAQDGGQPAPADASTEDLVIGDWYKIDAKRGQLSNQFAGRLVKMNEQWLVLRVHAFTRVATSELAQIPVVGTPLFTKVKEFSEYYWIPRDAATVAERKVNMSAEPLVTVDGESPPTGQECGLSLDAAGKLDWKDAKIFEVTDRILVLANEQVAIKSVLGIQLMREGDDSKSVAKKTRTKK